MGDVRRRPAPLDLGIAAGVAAFFGTWSLAVLWVARPGWSAALGLAAVAAPVALAPRRVRPLGSFVAVSAACGVLLVAPGSAPLLPSLAAFPVSLYSYCAWGRRPAPAAGIAVGIAGAAAAGAHLVLSRQLIGTGLSPLFPFGFVLGVVLTAWSLGLYRRVQLAYIEALHDRTRRAEAEREERARRAVLEERARISRETHDIVAHSLSVIVTQAQGGLYAAAADPRQATAALERIADTGRQALAAMRTLLGVLRIDPTPSPSPPEPQPALRDLPELLDGVRASGLSVAFSETGVAGGLGPTAELAAYRVVQEALTNTLRHAGSGARAEVRLDWTGSGLDLTVRDDGTASTPGDGAGRGLIGMRERVAAAGGSLTAGPAKGNGFLVQACLPRSA